MGGHRNPYAGDLSTEKTGSSKLLLTNISDLLISPSDKEALAGFVKAWCAALGYGYGVLGWHF